MCRIYGYTTSGIAGIWIGCIKVTFMVISLIKNLKVLMQYTQLGKQKQAKL